jgi:hypothetical protein
MEQITGTYIVRVAHQAAKPKHPGNVCTDLYPSMHMACVKNGTLAGEVLGVPFASFVCKIWRLPAVSTRRSVWEWTEMTTTRLAQTSSLKFAFRCPVCYGGPLYIGRSCPGESSKQFYLPPSNRAQSQFPKIACSSAKIIIYVCTNSGRVIYGGSEKQTTAKQQNSE